MIFTTPYQLLKLTDTTNDSRNNPKAGGDPDNWDVIETGNLGVVQAKRVPQEQLVAVRQASVVPYTLKMPVDSLVDAQMRIQLPGEGMLLEVVGVAKNPAVPLWLLVTADEVR